MDMKTPIASTLSLSFKVVLPLLTLLIAVKASPHLHRMCLNIISDKKAYHFIPKAVVCGKKQTPHVLTESLARSGLLHLFVTSGAHLQFLLLLLGGYFWWQPHRPLPVFFAFLSGLFYLSVCQFPPPLLRAGLQFIGSGCNRWLMFNAPRWLIALMTTLIPLLIFPEWTASWSFVLSVYCGLIMAYRQPSDSSFRFNFRIYVLLLPFFIQWTPPSVLSIAINMLLTPILGVVLIPICLIDMFTPTSFNFISHFWDFLFNLLAQIPVPTESHTQALSILIYWIYTLCTGVYLEWHSKSIGRMAHPFNSSSDQSQL